MPQGFTATILAIILFSGVQLISLGLIGEYVLRIYNQVRNRPLFIIDKIFQEGEEANQFYLIRAGKIALEIHVPQSGELMLDTLSEGGQLLPNGHKIGKSSHLFKRISDDTIAAQLSKLHASRKEEPTQTVLETKPQVEFEDFTKLDIRTATVVAAEKMPKAKKLLKIEVDLGHEKRTVVSGIAEYYKPEDLPGKQVLLLTNLKPRKLRGVESQGMILMAENDNGELSFVSPEKQWEPGSPVK